MSKEEALKWKNKEKELLAEIKSLQKQKDEISRSVRSKDQQIDKLKSVESKHTAEIEALKAKLKSASVKDSMLKDTSRTTSVDNIAKQLASLHSSHNNSMDSDSESVNIPPQIKPKAVSKRPLFLKDVIDLPDNCMPAYRTEKWIGSSGGTLKMPLLNVVIPRDCFETKTQITAVKICESKEIIKRIKGTCLDGIVEPVLHVLLEPQGMALEGEAYFELLGCINNPRYRYVIVQKESDFFNQSEWFEITNEANARFTKGSILKLLIHSLSSYVVLRLDVPVTSFIGNNLNQSYSLGPLNQSVNINAPRVYYGGVNTDVMISIVNNKLKNLEFHIYHDIKDKCLNVWAKEVQNKKLTRHPSLEDTVENGQIKETTRHMFINKLTAPFPLCENDRIYFHFDQHKKWQQMGIIDFDELSQPKGQLFKVALSVKKSGPPGAPTVHMEKMPKIVTITRRIADRLEAQEICHLNMTDAPISNQYQVASITTAVIDKVLARVRIRILRTVDVKYIIEIMKRKDVFTALERDDIMREKTPYTRAKLFMDYLARKGGKGMVALCDALEADYVGLAHEIRAILQSNV